MFKLITTLVVALGLVAIAINAQDAPQRPQQRQRAPQTVEKQQVTQQTIVCPKCGAKIECPFRGGKGMGPMMGMRGGQGFRGGRGLAMQGRGGFRGGRGFGMQQGRRGFQPKQDGQTKPAVN